MRHTEVACSGTSLAAAYPSPGRTRVVNISELTDRTLTHCSHKALRTAVKPDQRPESVLQYVTQFMTCQGRFRAQGGLRGTGGGAGIVNLVTSPDLRGTARERATEISVAGNESVLGWGGSRRDVWRKQV
ncbi:hypothetical protein SKAU_G00128920 [Synaphobranchus kaupii]|uniref:Uncharacterized protein n=1 Tax=Synaphobranchus kaupii TaxID=118154 RepID=A0A9Q1FQ08_SYNKA|nr:hypothetical protein SKAU_G00128920 [Synaphobranchus kaupii]